MGKHGGLAKAGKVRKRTPKVDKDVRKGHPKFGRAKMRELYRKRFNEDDTPVTKRPNAQGGD